MQTLTEKAQDLLAYLDKNAKPEEKQNALPTIGELLAQSRAQHAIYRRSLRHRANGVTVDGNIAAATEAVSAAARLRAQAEVRDPKHEDIGWADDIAAKFPHEAMMPFYEEEVRYYVPPVYDVKSAPVDEPKPVDDAPEVAEHAKTR